jgi:hypothetical protein
MFQLNTPQNLRPKSKLYNWGAIILIVEMLVVFLATAYF